MSDYFKYPRTYHLPWSPGCTSDDKVMKELSVILDSDDCVISEKADGENSSLYFDHLHARSMDSKDHPSRHWLKGFWGSVRFMIPNGWRVCGENLFAKHSIAYDDLDSYFYVFSIWDENNVCLSWDDTVKCCEEWGLTPVKILYRGKIDLSLLKVFHERLDLDRQEGFVIRTAGSFKFGDFNKHVAKWVRKGHVQTDEHWMFKKVEKNKLKI